MRKKRLWITRDANKTITLHEMRPSKDDYNRWWKSADGMIDITPRIASKLTDKKISWLDDEPTEL